MLSEAGSWERAAGIRLLARVHAQQDWELGVPGTFVHLHEESGVGQVLEEVVVDHLPILGQAIGHGIERHGGVVEAPHRGLLPRGLRIRGLSATRGAGR